MNLYEYCLDMEIALHFSFSKDGWYVFLEDCQVRSEEANVTPRGSGKTQSEAINDLVYKLKGMSIVPAVERSYMVPEIQPEKTLDVPF